MQRVPLKRIFRFQDLDTLLQFSTSCSEISTTTWEGDSVDFDQRFARSMFSNRIHEHPGGARALALENTRRSLVRKFFPDVYALRSIAYASVSRDYCAPLYTPPLRYQLRLQFPWFRIVFAGVSLAASRQRTRRGVDPSSRSHSTPLSVDEAFEARENATGARRGITAREEEKLRASSNSKRERKRRRKKK